MAAIIIAPPPEARQQDVSISIRLENELPQLPKSGVGVEKVTEISG